MRDIIAKLITRAVSRSADVQVFVPEHEAFGHYSTNVALRLAKEAKRPPIELAGELALRIQEIAPKNFFDKVEAAPPGFVNFWLSAKTLQGAFEKLYDLKNTYGLGTNGEGKKVIVEYSQPNIAKQLHMGHLRNTVIGDALARIYAAVGYKVIRWNYMGDWGTQFGKVIAAYRLWGNKKEIEKNPVKTLADLYVRFHDEAKKDPALEARGQLEFKKLEEGNAENRKLWKWFRSESVKELKNIYKTLGVKFDVWISESFFEKELGPLVADLVRKKIAVRSEGPLVIPIEGKKLPALIQKSDGASLYLTRDIANLRYRIAKYRPAKILYVVGNEQALHFEQLFDVAKILGLTQSELVHVKYGLVLGEDAKKLATRAGKTVLLTNVLEKAIELSRTIVQKKNPSLSLKEKDAIARAVGIGALKYYNLKEHRTSDIAFDWERILDLTGNSGPYLQYSYARFSSIKKKAGKIGKADIGALREVEELKLIRALIEFPSTVASSADALLTSTLAEYLYTLAVQANKFYETIPILKDENVSRRNARLLLVEMVMAVLGRGMGLLGIETVKRI